MRLESKYLIWGEQWSRPTGQELCGKKVNTVRCNYSNNDNSNNGRSSNISNSERNRNG